MESGIELKSPPERHRSELPAPLFGELPTVSLVSRSGSLLVRVSFGSGSSETVREGQIDAHLRNGNGTVRKALFDILSQLTNTSISESPGKIQIESLTIFPTEPVNSPQDIVHAVNAGLQRLWYLHRAF